MSKLIKLADLCIKITDGSHYSPQGTAKGYPMLSSKDMQDYDFDFSQCKYISEDDYIRMVDNDCKPLVNDVLIIKDGNSYLQKVFVVREERECAILSSIGVLRPDALKLDPYYLKYYLSSDFVKREVAKKYVTGSALPRIILKNFGDIEIPYIDIKLQEKVVSVLKLIDLKIENNNKINMELESMSKTIYDYWFLQFEFPNENGKPYKSFGGKMVWNEELKREIPEGWKVGNLYDIAEFINGLACQKYRPINQNGKIPVIKIKEMHEGINDNTEYVREDIPEKNIVNDGDILFSWSATLETMIWTGGKGGLNQHIFKIIPKEYAKYYVYMQLSAYIINFAHMAEARKTTMGHITTDHLKQSRIALPPKKITDMYDEKAQGIFNERICNSRQNRELILLRDFLLPLLMNGQVGFKD
jgi:type I restriction enzyme S subunit